MQCLFTLRWSVGEWQVTVNSLMQRTHLKSWVWNLNLNLNLKSWMWKARGSSRRLTWGMLTVKTLSRNFSLTNSRRTLEEGGNCYAWSTSSAEEFSHPKTSRKINFSFTHTSAERKCFFEEREEMMPICLIVTLKGALNHSGAVTIKTFFSLAG